MQKSPTNRSGKGSGTIILISSILKHRKGCLIIGTITPDSKDYGHITTTVLGCGCLFLKSHLCMESYFIIASLCHLKLKDAESLESEICKVRPPLILQILHHKILIFHYELLLHSPK